MYISASAERRVYRFHRCIEHHMSSKSLPGHIATYVHFTDATTDTNQSPQHSMCLAGCLVFGKNTPVVCCVAYVIVAYVVVAQHHLLQLVQSPLHQRSPHVHAPPLAYSRADARQRRMKSGPRLVEPKRRATLVTLAGSQCPYDVILFLCLRMFIEPQGASHGGINQPLRHFERTNPKVCQTLYI